ncbi:MAG: hypothetical protein HUK19_09115 [Fibrobacter sp.]|nr:hypothetical protein [Fibrobacter sp.]
MKFLSTLLLGVFITVGALYFVYPNWRSEVKISPFAEKVIKEGMDVVGDVATAVKEKSPGVAQKVKSVVGESAEQVKRFVIVNGFRLAEYDLANTSELHKDALSRVKLKDKTVNVKRLRPEMDSALVVVVGVYWEVLGSDYVPVVTSGNDYSGHTYNSKHYKNSALDFRTRDPNISKEKRQLIKDKVRAKLDDRYYVLLESPGQSSEHLHVQYNGKR